MRPECGEQLWSLPVIAALAGAMFKRADLSCGKDSFDHMVHTIHALQVAIGDLLRIDTCVAVVS
jgi:hypothetical protein